MSDMNDQQSTVDRGALAARAAAQEQRNRPRIFVVLGAIVLVVGAAYMLIGRSSLGGAKDDRRREIASYSTVQVQKARLRGHLDRADADGGELQPVPNFTTLAENAARSAGLTTLPTLTRQDQTRDGELIVRTYQYNRVMSRDLEALLGWVSQVEAMVPGVEISRFELSPSRTQWQLSITFVKPELSS